MFHEIVLDGSSLFGGKMSWFDAIEKHRANYHCQYGIDDAQMCRNVHWSGLLLRVLNCMMLL